MDGANKAVDMFLVVCSQISARRFSLLISHKQRTAFYPNGFGKWHHHGRKVHFWMGGGQIEMHNPLAVMAINQTSALDGRCVLIKFGVSHSV